MHRKALAISRIGEVKQIITEDEEGEGVVCIYNALSFVSSFVHSF